MITTLRVFSQQPDERIDVAGLIRQAKRFFEASLEILSQKGTLPIDTAAVEAPFTHEIRLRLESARRGFSAEFCVRSRETTADDRESARRAEVRGQATGMSQLAERCPRIWEVESVGDAIEAAALNLCAVLAAVALGPVLPPDESTLFGIRGAMERVERLTGPSLLR